MDVTIRPVIPAEHDAVAAVNRVAAAATPRRCSWGRCGRAGLRGSAAVLDGLPCPSLAAAAGPPQDGRPRGGQHQRRVRRRDPSLPPGVIRAAVARAADVHSAAGGEPASRRSLPRPNCCAHAASSCEVAPAGAPAVGSSWTWFTPSWCRAVMIAPWSLGVVLQVTGILTTFGAWETAQSAHRTATSRHTSSDTAVRSLNRRRRITPSYRQPEDAESGGAFTDRAMISRLPPTGPPLLDLGLPEGSL